jgi:hypothetical protein
MAREAVTAPKKQIRSQQPEERTRTLVEGSELAGCTSVEERGSKGMMERQ